MEDLLAAIPNRELAQKLRALLEERRRPSSSLCDHVNFNMRGRIKMEMYDKDGNVIETIDQDNLVTDYAWEILTRLVASDPNANGYQVPELMVNGQPVNRYDGSSPEVRWLFSTTPRTIYRHQLQTRSSVSSSWSTIQTWYDYNPDKTTTETNYRRELVSVYLSSSSLGGEQYMIGYIGIGDGEDYMIPVTDADTFDFEGKWEIKEEKGAVGGRIARTSQAGDKVTITFHGTRLIGFFSYTEDGADVEVTVDGVSKGTFSLYSATTSTGMKRVLADELPDGEHTVVLTHKGTGYNAELDMFTMNIESVRANGLTKSLNSLFREIPRTTNRVDVPELYNTASAAPYTFKLERGHLGIVPGSETVIFDGETLVRTETAPTQANEYAIDYTTGTIRMARPAMGVQVTYQTEQPFSTNYERAAITRPSPGSPNYPWYDLSRARIYFIADFPPGVPNYPVKVREIGLFDFSDNISISKMFSIVRPGETVKEVDTGLRITWEIRLRD